MRVFLSWSGSKSKEAADALKAWLVTLLPGLEVWMSESDLEAGTTWGTALHDQLRQADFGILCVTAENLNAPWMLYEAGALAISSTAGCVVPYLLDVAPQQLLPPLSLFQSAAADKEGTWKIVKSMNRAQHTELTEDHLRQVFEKQWPMLAAQLGLSVRTCMRGDVLVLTPSDAQLRYESEIKPLREKIRDLAQSGHKRIIVDLVEVKWLSSTGLSVIFPAVAAAHRKEAEVVLANLAPGVRELFEVTRMIQLVQVFPTLNDALAYFARQVL